MAAILGPRDDTPDPSRQINTPDSTSDGTPDPPYHIRHTGSYVSDPTVRSCVTDARQIMFQDDTSD